MLEPLLRGDDRGRRCVGRGRRKQGPGAAAEAKVLLGLPCRRGGGYLDAAELLAHSAPIGEVRRSSALCEYIGVLMGVLMGVLIGVLVSGCC